MTRAIAVFTIFLMTLSALYGCGSGSGSAPGTSGPTGSVVLQVDLSKLTPRIARTLALAEVTSITSVTATLTGENFGPAKYDLTVSGNTASGRIDNLPSGNMNIVLDAYNGTTLLYTGSSVVNVVPGAEAKTQVLLDPVNTGSVSIDVGLNPIPGYKIVSQNVGASFFYDSTGGKTYLLDYPAKRLDVYTPQMSTYLKSFTLPDGMNELAMSVDGKNFFVGCIDGQIYSLDTVSGVTEPLANVSHRFRSLVAVNAKYLLAAVELPTGMTRLVVIDVTTGNVTATSDYAYYIYAVVVNSTNGVVYGQDVNVSPQNIHRIQIDTSTGAIVDVSPSKYAGAFNFSYPLRIVENGTLLVAASGETFTSSADPTQDLVPSGGINGTYHDLACDDVLGFLYLARYYEKKLTVLRSNDFSTARTLDLPVSPLALYQTNDSIVVFGHNFGDPNYYVTSFRKSDLGIIATP